MKRANKIATMLSLAFGTIFSILQADASNVVPIFKTARGVNLYAPYMTLRRVPSGDVNAHLRYGDWESLRRNRVVEQLTQVGFDTVRLPVSLQPLLAEPDLLDLHFRDIDAGINELLSGGLDVVVDLHVVPGGNSWNQSAITESAEGSAFAAYRDVVDKMARFLSKFDPHRVALELFNEPPCAAPNRTDWPILQKRLFDAARRAAPKLPLVVTGACWGSASALTQLRASDYDDNTLFTFHFYEPHIFTHQGTSNKSDSASYVSRLPYPPEASRRDEFIAEFNSRIQTERSLPAADKSRIADHGRKYLNLYFSEKSSKDTMKTLLAGVVSWARQNQVSMKRIWVGEFGVTRDAFGQTGTAPADRQRWLKDARETFEELGIGWAVWNYCCQTGIIQGDFWGPFDPAIIHALGLNDVRRPSP